MGVGVAVGVGRRVAVGGGVCVGGTAVTVTTGSVVEAMVGGMGVGETAVWQAVNKTKTKNKLKQ